jgi:hypothetical protein
MSICRDVSASADRAEANREAFVITAVITPNNSAPDSQRRMFAKEELLRDLWSFKLVGISRTSRRGPTPRYGR